MMKRRKTLRVRTQRFLMVLVGALAAACGGGGGDPASEPQAGPTPAALQGRWSTPAGSASAYVALIVPDTGSAVSSQAWVLSQDGATLARLTLSGTQVRGSLYSLSGQAPASVLGTLILDASRVPKTLSLPGPAATTLLSQVDGLNAQALLSDAAGTWSGALDKGYKTLSLSVGAADGVISGISSTGCTYRGRLAPRAGVGVFDASLTEVCPGVAVQSFAGLATASTASNRFTLVLVSEDNARALVLLMSR